MYLSLKNANNNTYLLCQHFQHTKYLIILCVYIDLYEHTHKYLFLAQHVHCILCSGTKACEMKLLVGLKENENENEEELRESVGNIGNYHLGVQ